MSVSTISRVFLLAITFLAESTYSLTIEAIEARNLNPVLGARDLNPVKLADRSDSKVQIGYEDYAPVRRNANPDFLHELRLVLREYLLFFFYFNSPSNFGLYSGRAVTQDDVDDQEVKMANKQEDVVDLKKELAQLSPGGITYQVKKAALQVKIKKAENALAQIIQKLNRLEDLFDKGL